MGDNTSLEQPQFKNIGWRVTFAALGINLALGILYTWSVIVGSIPEDWGWTQSDKSMPYAVACLVFSLVMVPAGRMQDKISPRIVATIGGILVGIGMIGASFTTSPMGFMIGFGILAGAGIGFGYASATPPAVKWFPAAKTGMIAGIVVSGFGLASVYAAPLAKSLATAYGVQKMMFILGIAFMFVVVGLAQLLKAPHKVEQDIKGLGNVGKLKQQAMAKENVRQDNLGMSSEKKEDYTPKEMLATKQFYMLWFMYACGAGAGLMIISVAKKIGDEWLVDSMAVAAVVGLAIGNGGGRIIAGMISDKLGRKPTLFIFFVFQAILLFLLTRINGENILTTAPALIIITALIGANYGSNLALFPSITKDYYGLKNFGVNYGLVFTAWGVGGFMLAKLAGMMYDKYQSFNSAYFMAAALLVLAAIMVFFVKPPHHVMHAVGSEHAFVKAEEDAESDEVDEPETAEV